MESFFFPPHLPLLLLFGQAGVGGGGAMMIRHYVPQPKRQGSNVSTKCQVASLVSRLVSSVVFSYLIVSVSKKRGGKDGERWKDRRVMEVRCTAGGGRMSRQDRN